MWILIITAVGPTGNKPMGGYYYYSEIHLKRRTNEGAYLGVQALLSSDFAHKTDSIEL